VLEIITLNPLLAHPVYMYIKEPGLLNRYTDSLTVRESNPGGGEIFYTCPDRPWEPPSLLYNGYLVFPGGTAAVCGFDHPPLSSTEVKERVEL